MEGFDRAQSMALIGAILIALMLSVWGWTPQMQELAGDVPEIVPDESIMLEDFESPIYPPDPLDGGLPEHGELDDMLR